VLHSLLAHFSPKINNTSQAEKMPCRVFANTRAAKDDMVITLTFPDTRKIAQLEHSQAL